MINSKVILGILGVLAIIFLASWLFNHVQPWIGIGVIIIALVAINEYLRKLFK